MKKIAFLIIGSTVLFQMCTKELGPNIQLIKPEGSSDSSYIETSIPTADAKVVLLEEFSGVHCPNCPKGHIASENIIAANPNKVVGVTLHVNESRDALTHPYNFANAQNFQTEEATSIEAAFAHYASMPCALIDRVHFSGEPVEAVSNYNAWSTDVTSQLALTTPVNIKMTNSWDNATRTIRTRIELHYTEAVTADQNLSVMIAEDDIVNPQYNQTLGGIDTFYTHHHNILRKMMTAATGNTISYPKEKGRVVIYYLESKNIPALWKEDHLNIIAFVHNSGSSQTVIQTIEKPLK